MCYSLGVVDLRACPGFDFDRNGQDIAAGHGLPCQSWIGHNLTANAEEYDVVAWAEAITADAAALVTA